MNTLDEYQERYLAHQQRKREVLKQIIEDRHSDRVFADLEVHQEDINALLGAVDKCPSSCDRKAVNIKVITDRDDKALLSGLLVGGVGWIHRAPAIFLLFADPQAYKAIGEIDYMPYLDAGIVIQQLYLTATAIDMHCAYSNPNIRQENIEFFKSRFGDGIFCGAFAFGYKKGEK